MRILMLAWEYPPRIIGGLARVVYFLSQEMAKLGHEVHVITADAEDLPAYDFDLMGVHVHRVETLSWPNPGFIVWNSRLNFAMIKTAIRLHQRHPFDIVHAHDWLVADTALILRELGLPVIATIHATEFGRGITSLDGHYIDRIDRELVHSAGKVIVNSRHMFDELRGHFQLPDERLVVIPNGIDVDRMCCRHVVVEARPASDGKTVLFVGRLVREKGVQYLLKAAPRILRRHPTTQFVVAGAGYYRQELEALSEKLNVTKSVSFFGQANDAQLAELYGDADLLVVPSLYEPFGIVDLEGMAHSLPIVVSDAGGLKDIVADGADGVVTKAGRAVSLAAGINKVLDDEDFARRLSKAAREKVVAHYSWAAIAERTLQEYLSIPPGTIAGVRSDGDL